MRVVALMTLGACGFSGPAVGGAIAPLDAPDSFAGCAIAPRSSGMPTKNLGEQSGAPFGHGSLQLPLMCPAPQIVGSIGFDMTKGPVAEGGNGGEPVATGISITCNAIDFEPSGAQHAKASPATSYASHGGCMSFQMPITLAPVACPNGLVPVGLGGNSDGQSLFNTISVKCGTLAFDGTVGASTASVDVAGSAWTGKHPELAACPANAAIIGFEIQGDCGIDDLAPICAPLVCQ